ncbi:ABC transporter ATP-binding protein [Microbacterium istanbulense]|uniref:ABC transporter ATP-binding protein n=1 Tax=Microbacterium istanbulense TaxID=3122049 RepID=A0ABU8LJ30_9MICO
MTLTVSHVRKSFGADDVLDDVSFRVPRGSRLALVGPSGGGKSTLLRVIGGFETPDAGTVELDDRRLVGDGVNVPAHRRRIGYVPQDGALFPHLSVAGNIGFGLPRAARQRTRIAELMELCSLASDLADRLPHELSGGQQQRVALARTLATSPDVVLLDEPFSALDAELREATRTAVAEIIDRTGVTAVLVTHDHTEALTFGDLVGVLIDGSLVQYGAPEAVYGEPVDLRVARLLGDTVVLPARRQGAQALTPLGVIDVGRDLAGEASAVVALLRPDQLRVRPEPQGMATVAHVRHGGATTAVTLAIGEDTVTVMVPRRDADALAVGVPAHVTVDGAAVLYPAALPR